MEYVALNIFLLWVFLGLLLNIFGLSGPIVILVGALLFAVIDGFSEIGIAALIALTILATTSEVVDYLLGARGAGVFALSSGSLGWGALGGTALALMLTPQFLGPGLIIGVFTGAATGVFLREMRDMGRIRASLRNYRAILLGAAAVLCRGFVSLIMIGIILNSLYS